MHDHAELVCALAVKLPKVGHPNPRAFLPSPSHAALSSPPFLIRIAKPTVFESVAAAPTPIAAGQRQHSNPLRSDHRLRPPGHAACTYVTPP